MGVIFFLTQSFEFNFEETKPTFLYLIPILIILGGGLGEYLFRKRIK